MKAQISRHSYRPRKLYSGVYQQQGRMLTDADWNELVEIAKARLESALADVVGDGAPTSSGVVDVGDNLDIKGLRKGALYADGVRGEVRATKDGLGATELYDNQQDFPQAPARDGDADYLFYVDIWERPVVSLQDEGLLDPALHGADTCFRTQTLAQIKWCPAIEPEPYFVDTDKCPQHGDAALKLGLREAVAAPDPCDPCAEELDLEERVGNYLFRLEVHDVKGDADAPDEVVLKWSGENAAEHHRNVEDEQPQGFKSGNHVYEFFNEVTERHLGVHAPEAAGAPVRRDLDPSYPAAPPDAGDFPFVRRWDGTCVLEHDGGGWRLKRDAGGAIVGRDEGDPLIDGPGVGHAEVTGGELRLGLKRLILVLALEDSSFVAGDYWLAAVRERAPQAPEDERVTLASTKPVGIIHHYAKLIVVKADGGFVPLAELPWWRSLCFPPLTDLPASHVSFDNDCPQLYGEAETVQTALDALCERVDFEALLRKHNRYLHGWGVICGLKVRCHGENQEIVLVGPGCAYDREGYNLELGEAEKASIPDLLDGEGDGEFLLSLARTEAGGHRYHLDPMDEPGIKDSIWEGTLLYRIKKQCFDPLVEVFKKLQEKRPAGARWALHDLFWPVFYKGAERPFLTPQEHDILEDLYAAFLKFITSPTDCGLAAEAAKFPEYPFTREQVHGVALRRPATNVRAQRDGARLYAFDSGHEVIQVIDTEKMAVEREVKVVVGERPVDGIIDVAVNGDGRIVVIAATVSAESGTRSVLFRYDPVSGTHTPWLETRRRVVNIRLAPGPGGPLFVLVHDRGIFTVSLRGNKLDRFAHIPAYGHLALTANDGAVLAVSREKEQYVIHGFDRTGNLLFEGIELGKWVPESLATVGDRAEKIFVAGGKKGAAGPKQLLIYAGKPEPKLQRTIVIDEGQVRLAAVNEGQRSQIFVSLGKIFQVSALWWFDAEAEDWKARRYLSAQLQPNALEPAAGTVFALNTYSRSVLKWSLKLPLGLKTARLAADYRKRIEKYRIEVVLAFIGVLRLWVRAIRDCVCFQLMPDCPETVAPPHKVPLAALTLKGGAVDRICNIGHRKYVVTFPSLLYWLSLVPIIPWIVRWLREFCCRAEVPFFEGLLPAEKDLVGEEPAAPTGVVLQPSPGFVWRGFQLKGEPRGLGQALQAAALAAPLIAVNPRLDDIKTSLPRAFGQFTGTRILDLATRVVDAQVLGAQLPAADVTDKPADEAKYILERAGIKVTEVIDIAEAELPDDVEIIDAALAPILTKVGDDVTLVVKDGRTLFHAIRQPKVRITAADLVKIEPEIKDKIAEFERRKETLADLSELTAGLAAVEARRTEVMKLDAVMAEITTLKTEKLEITGEVEALRLEIKGLGGDRAELAKLEGVRGEIVALGEKRLRLTGEVESLRAAVTSLGEEREAIGDVAALDHSLAALEERRRTLTSESTKIVENIEGLERRKETVADLSELTAGLAAVEARRAEVVKLEAVQGEVTTLERKKREISDEVEALRTEIEGLGGERAELAKLEGVRNEIVALGQEKTRLVGEVETLRAAVTSVGEERAEIADVVGLERMLAALDERRRALTSETTKIVENIGALENRRLELGESMKRARPISDIVTEAQDTALGRLGITTIGDLAAVDDPRRLVVRGGPRNLTAARKLVTTARSRLR